MALLKCEMCGGTLILEDNGAYAVCEYCGTRIATSGPVTTVSSNGTVNIQQQNNHFTQMNALRIENEKRRTEEAKAQAEQARLGAESQRLEYERLAEQKRIEKKARKKKLVKRLVAIFLTLSALFALGVLTITVIIPSAKYNSAEKAFESGDYEEAYLTFKSLYSFKDSEQKATDIVKKYPYVAQVGDIIYMGNYEQDNNLSNGKEEIEWIVLEKDDNGKMLVVSKYALDCRHYHSSAKQVTWENSDLRAWLNKDFISSAFTKSERALIKATSIENNGNSDYKVDGSKNTTDSIFLLSIDEAKRYFPKTIDRICKSTAYADSQGSELGTLTEYCRWWLRNPGSSLYNASSVKIDGFILEVGTPVSVDKSFVRPAMWVEFK